MSFNLIKSPRSVNLLICVLLSSLLIQNIYRDDKILIISNLFQLTTSLRYILSFNARNYIQTLDKTYLDDYFKILNIRDGDGDFYDLFPYAWLKENKMKQLLEILYNFLNKNNSVELDQLKKIYDSETDLIWTEISSMNWINGNIDPNDVSYLNFKQSTHIDVINFKTKEEPDKLLNLKLKAKSSLFDPSYIKSSTEININYTKQFKQIITSYDKNIKRNKILYFIIVFISITISFYLLLSRDC